MEPAAPKVPRVALLRKPFHLVPSGRRTSRTRTSTATTLQPMHSESGSEHASCGWCANPAVLPRQVAWLQWITLAWMTLECGASLWAAAQSHSIALLAFGSDSLVEMLSATVVLLQFVPRFPLKKAHADKSTAV